jgi:hypothetical protein
MHIQYERDDPECLTSFIFEETETDEMADFQSWLKDNGMSYKKIRIPGAKGRVTCLVVEQRGPVAEVEVQPVKKMVQEPVVEVKKQVVPVVEAKKVVEESESETEQEPEQPKKGNFSFVEEDEEEEMPVSEDEEVQFKAKKKDKKKDKKK